MIKINLCPIDELESQYWYVPELVVAVLVAALGWFGAQWYLGGIQDQVDEVTAKTQSLNDSAAKLAPDLERFKDLDKDVSALNAKLAALKTITVSKISKYKPVIVLEHLQNLKPDGVWYSSVKIGFPISDGKPSQIDASGNDTTFEIKGQAFDNILTAELMTAFRSTDSQELDQADLRTQVFFSDLSLPDTSLKGGGGAGFPELARFPEFQIRGHYNERTEAAAPPGEAPPGAPAAAPPPPVPPPVAENDEPKDRRNF